MCFLQDGIYVSLSTEYTCAQLSAKSSVGRSAGRSAVHVFLLVMGPGLSLPRHNALKREQNHSEIQKVGFWT